jgi:hypothetical protein
MLFSYIVLSLAQAHLTRILLTAEILSKPRAWLQGKHPLLQKLLSCPMCTGFWTALLGAIAFPVASIPLDTLTIAGLGFTIYMLVELLPCDKCSHSEPSGEFRVVR